MSTAAEIANFYTEIGNLIRAENPYGDNVEVADISTTFGESVPERNGKVAALQAKGVQIMGWLRDFWRTRPKEACNHQMTITEKQQSFQWATIYENAPGFANAANPPAGPLHPGGAAPIFNSPNFELHQICKALYIPFQYTTTDGRKLDVAIVVGFKGAGGGE